MIMASLNREQWQSSPPTQLLKATDHVKNSKLPKSLLSEHSAIDAPFFRITNRTHAYNSHIYQTYVHIQRKILSVCQTSDDYFIQKMKSTNFAYTRNLEVEQHLNPFWNKGVRNAGQLLKFFGSYTAREFSFQTREFQIYIRYYGIVITSEPHSHH